MSEALADAADATAARTLLVHLGTAMVATGQPISSSMRRTYFTAAPGRSAQLRAPSVDCDQPSTSS